MTTRAIFATLQHTSPDNRSSPRHMQLVFFTVQITTQPFPASHTVFPHSSRRSDSHSIPLSSLFIRFPPLRKSLDHSPLPSPQRSDSHLLLPRVAQTATHPSPIPQSPCSDNHSTHRPSPSSPPRQPLTTCASPKSPAQQTIHTFSRQSDTHPHITPTALAAYDGLVC